MSISIDNPLIFVYPKPLVVPRQSNSALPSNGTPPDPQARDTQVTLFPSFRPFPSSSHRPSLSDSQIIQSSVHELDSRSTVLSGSLVLKFAKPKEIKKIVISLCGQSYIGFNDRPYEYQTILAKDLEIDLAAQLFDSVNQHPDRGTVEYNSQHKTYILDKGNYRFHWSFILPPDLPPYERGQFGRTTHKVVAKVKLGSGLGLGLKSVGKNLPSIIFGVGNGGHEIETESYFVAITYPSGNNDDISDNLGLNLNVTELSEHLGPYTLSASSSYFTVAGLLSFKFKLTDIPQRKKIIKIFKITCLIKQQYRLISMKDKDSRTGGPAESWPPCQRRRVFVLDHSNVSNMKLIVSNGRLLNPSDQLTDGYHAPDSDAPDSSVGCAASGSRTAISSRERSASHSRSRSQIREFLRTHTKSHERRHAELPRGSNNPHYSWNSLPSIRIGRRRAQSSRREAHEKSQAPRLYSSRSTDALESTSSVPSRIPQTHINCEASSRRNVASASPSYASGSLRHPLRNPISEVERNPQCLQQKNSGASHQLERSSGASGARAALAEPPLASVASTTSHRGRQQQTLSAASHAIQRKHDHKNQRGAKWRPGQRPHPPSHIDPDVPLVTLTNEHHSWEIEHIGRLPTDDIIRPSTNPATQTNIHIFHTLLFEISYSVEDDRRLQPTQSGIIAHNSAEHPSPSITKKVLSIRKPVQISSCCCMAESMVLPPYSKLDPNAEIVQHPTPSHAARMLKCVCDTPTDVLLKTQNPKNTQGSSNENRQIENHATSENTSSVTQSILTFRSSNSSFDLSSNNRGSQFNPTPQHCGINHLDNSSSGIK